MSQVYDGQLQRPTAGRPLVGRDTIPDIQHRTDIGVFLGKVLQFCGAISGDIGEVIVYSNSDRRRSAIGNRTSPRRKIWAVQRIAS
jgi:hypothetical protein